MIIKEKFDEIYSNYRLRVLSKANGADIHEINGLLGRILNSCNLLSRYRKQEDEKRYKKLLKDSIKEIRKHTGEDFYEISDYI